MEIDERRYRIIYNSLGVISGIVLVSFVLIEQYIFGSMAFLVLNIAYGYFEENAKKVTWDERDRRIAGAASGYTINIIAIFSAVFFPGLAIAHFLNWYEWRPWATGAAATVALVVVIYGTLNYYFSTKM